MISDPEGSEAQAPAAQEFAFSDGLTKLTLLPPSTIVFEDDLTQARGCHSDTIKRAVLRGELPRPMQLFGRSAWTVEAIQRHAARLMEEAAQQRAEMERKITRLPQRGT